MDIRCTSDGILTCAHDPTLRGRALIDLTARQLSDAGVPAFTSVLEAFVTAAAAAPREARLVVEVKNEPWSPGYTADAQAARLLVQLLAERLGAPPSRPPITVSSFDPASVRIARDAGWPTGLLTWPGVPLPEGLEQAQDLACTELHAHVGALAAARPDDVAHAEIGIVGWTVTSIREARALERLGVEAIICDDPAAVCAALRG